MTDSQREQAQLDTLFDVSWVLLPTSQKAKSNSDQSNPPRMPKKRVQHRMRMKRIRSEASTRSSTTMIGRPFRK